MKAAFPSKTLEWNQINTNLYCKRSLYVDLVFKYK